MRNLSLATIPNSVKITGIKTDRDGCKMIAFNRVHNYPKLKPQNGTTMLADFKNGVLRVFNRSDYSSFNIKTFGEALNFIRFRFTDY